MLAAAANPVPQCAALRGNVVYFGSGNFIARWIPGTTDVEVVGALEGRVSCVTVNNNVVWIGTESGLIYTYNDVLKVFASLERSITCIDSRDGKTAVGCIDGHVYVYTDGNSDNKMTIDIKGYALCVALYDNLLVIGGTAWKIYVFTLDTLLSTVLEGHENWVRSFSFKQEHDGSLLLASASQERYIRLWRFTKDSKEETELFTTKHTVGEWTVVFEALLMGHDDWVVSVSWDTHTDALLSASADSSLIVWESEASELWTPNFRLGDVSTWGASTATGTSGGFWTCLWLSDSVATVTRTGSWRVWSRDGWKLMPGISGHFKTVTDIQWLNNACLLTTSLDQTTRLWYVGESEMWELGRPQIHGYDMIACCAVSPTEYVSAGDEKTIRVFEMPRQVAEQICAVTSTSDALDVKKALPDVAAQPALGLSNKPDAGEGAVTTLPSHPREDHLQRLTLWPEIEKLYGHGYEVSTITYSSRGIIASCSKAKSEQHAKIRFFSTENWHELAPAVGGHQLTVTRLRASPNGERVLSVSRDRKWMVVNLETHEVEVEKPKAHTRIIWDAAWLNDNEFVTVSRDKSVKRWNLAGELLGSQTFEEPITAVDCNYNGEIVVIGDEKGIVVVLSASDLQVLKTVEVAGRVNRIALHPSASKRCFAVASEMVDVFHF